MDRIYTLEEVAKHNKPEDAWIVVKGRIYDVTKFAALHPGKLFKISNCIQVERKF